LPIQTPSSSELFFHLSLLLPIPHGADRRGEQLLVHMLEHPDAEFFRAAAQRGASNICIASSACSTMSPENDSSLIKFSAVAAISMFGTFTSFASCRLLGW
jgi:hypothetical protein